MDHAEQLRAFAGRLIRGSLDQRGINAAADEIERLRDALGELVLRHDIGGTNGEILAAWERARELI